MKPVSYDVHIKGIIEDDGTVESYRLRPNEVVFIESEEMIKMPLDLMGVSERKIPGCVKVACCGTTLFSGT